MPSNHLILCLKRQLSIVVKPPSLWNLPNEIQKLRQFLSHLFLEYKSLFTISEVSKDGKLWVQRVRELGSLELKFGDSHKWIWTQAVWCVSGVTLGKFLHSSNPECTSWWTGQEYLLLPSRITIRTKLYKRQECFVKFHNILNRPQHLVNSFLHFSDNLLLEQTRKYDWQWHNLSVIATNHSEYVISTIT